ncbi:MAG: hypothetical protein WD029_08170, partial [Microthrixaceae bacterium]
GTVDLVALRAAVVERFAATDTGVVDTAFVTTCSPLPSVRWSEPYELLRDRSDAYLALTGKRPEVFLVNLGPVEVHTARATFAKNFFEAGGVAAISSELSESRGFENVEDAVNDAIQSGCALACICSSDAVYTARAAEFAEGLTAAGVSRVYLAGNPGDRRTAELAAGVNEFIHVGVNLIEVLDRALSSLELASRTTARKESGE